MSILLQTSPVEFPNLGAHRLSTGGARGDWTGTNENASVSSLMSREDALLTYLFSRRPHGDSTMFGFLFAFSCSQAAASTPDNWNHVMHCRDTECVLFCLSVCVFASYVISVCQLVCT